MDVTPDLTPSLPGAALTMPRTGVRAAVAALAAVLLVIAGLPAFAAGQGGTSVGSYLVEAGSVLPDGARIVQPMPFIDAVIVDSPTPVGASLDTPARAESLITEPFDGLQLDSAVASTGAPQVWAAGERGSRSVVALIDTGVANVPALEGAVAGEIDFTGADAAGDGYGHGTFMASIIAGRGTVATGVAPEAGILSLKVAGDTGETTLGTILNAMQWLDGPGRHAGIRVAALAMAVEPGTQAADFLDRAADRLASHGILVITAAGNDGPGALTSPATSRGSFSVGAVDDSMTADRTDDVVAPFSGTGVDGRGVAQPDVVASGVNVVGSLPPDSVIAGGATPTEEGLYRGSGTSMSTAVAAGVAALAHSARPDLDGRTLDAALRAGGGELDAQASVAAALTARGGNGNGNGNGHGNGNGGGNGNGNGHGHGNGNADPQSVRWTSVRWTSVRWTSVRWTGMGWGDTGWGAQEWGSVRWTGRNWAYNGAVPQSVRWTSVRWTTVSWGTQP